MNIHDRARVLSAQRQIPIAEACRELSRRAAGSRRRKCYGRTTVEPDPSFDAIEQPKIRLPYSDN